MNQTLFGRRKSTKRIEMALGFVEQLELSSGPAQAELIAKIVIEFWREQSSAALGRPALRILSPSGRTRCPLVLQHASLRLILRLVADSSAKST